MKEYLDMVRHLLENGILKNTSHDVSTISLRGGYRYSVDISKKFPLLTTKKMDGGRWRSLVYELIWYLSGDHHIKNLKQFTKIWDAWADENDNLETAYGRFWRRFPVPSKGLKGEAWVKNNNKWVNEEDTGLTFDQISYVIDMLKNNPQSRRIIVSAWHPGNTSISKLPPCHYTFKFDVIDNELDVQLCQRSGDIALGIPFNIASYSLLAYMIAREVGLKPGMFHHLIWDLHAYCGNNERAQFYKDNMITIQQMLKNNEDPLKIKDFIENNASVIGSELDHIPGLLLQLSRKPFELPTLKINDNFNFNNPKFEDFELLNYSCYSSIKFKVSEVSYEWEKVPEKE